MDELMVEILIQYREIGILEANRNWIGCKDINGISTDFRNIKGQIEGLMRLARLTLFNIGLAISDDDMQVLEEECERMKYTARLQREIEIEREFRPTNITYDIEEQKILYKPMNYNTKALINMTQCILPDDISIGLSFGWKFLFPFVTSNENLHEIVSQLDCCIEDTINESRQIEASMEIARVLNNRREFQNDQTIQWLAFVSKRTKEFFDDNTNLFATRSDKGGHTVLIYNEQYAKAIDELLSDGNYDVINNNPLNDLVNTEEKLVNMLKRNYQCKDVSSVLRGYQPNTLQLAKFYGLPKIHKPGFKLRPITSMNGSPGHALGKIFNLMLKEIFPSTEYHTRDSYDIKKFLDGVKIPPTNVLKSFDVVSMFSNIPKELARDIIMEKQEEFFEKFGLAKRILLLIVKFLLDDSTVFTANGKTYKQKEGLPMGGCISPTIARLVMDKVITHLLRSVPSITFIKVFVDDTIAALDPELSDAALESLNSFHPNMKFTMESEDEDCSINFLNLTVIRDYDSLVTNWFRKPFASGRLVSYYSSHKKSTIIGTAQEFLKTVLLLSDPKFFVTNKQKVISTLKDNCFPDTVIESLMNKYYTLMRPIRNIVKKNTGRIVRYKIFPHATCHSRKIKGLITKLMDPDIILADSTKNTKINYINTRKTKIPWENRSNVIAISKCVCGLKFKIHSTRFNQTAGMMRDEILTVFDKCNSERHAFKKVKFHRGLAYNKQSQYLLKYIKYFYTGKLTNIRSDLPNYHLAKILKGVKIPLKFNKQQ